MVAGMLNLEDSGMDSSINLSAAFEGAVTAAPRANQPDVSADVTLASATISSGSHNCVKESVGGPCVVGGIMG